MKFTDENNAERLKFVSFWARYVREHEDKDWSRQQNVIINSCLRSASMTREAYLRMKSGSQAI
jgi:hypothetical protein